MNAQIVPHSSGGYGGGAYHECLACGATWGKAFPYPDIGIMKGAFAKHDCSNRLITRQNWEIGRKVERK